MTISTTDLKRIDAAITSRWGPRDWTTRFPWWGAPSKVRILMYADSGIFLDGGSFQGLQYVYNLLKSHAYHYVDFQVDFANRDGGDPSATIPGAKKLTDLDIVNKYDEVFFFGLASSGDLDAAEHTLLNQFMAAPKFGGLLVTGDHASLGKKLAGQIKRAGKMRQYPAPDSFSPVWNTTLVEGPDANATFDFNDQSDDTPQSIRYRRYPVGSLSPFLLRTRPHPVLCGIDGPITVFPDHQHEGEALAPAAAPGDPDWPTKAGHQEQPLVIAWGRIKDPAANKHGQEIGVLSAYDGHNVDVGRIVADSTWHHWFDINLLGIAAPPSPYAGYDATPAGQDVLKHLDAYFLNVGVWLAPPARQTEMRNAAWWSVLWDAQIVELPAKAPLWFYGDQALDALGRRAARCTVSRWVLDLPIFKEKIPQWEWPQLFERLTLTDVPLERYVAGGILQRLNRTFGPQSGNAFPQAAPDLQAFDKELQAGVEEGLKEMASALKAESAVVARWVESGFNVRKALG